MHKLMIPGMMFCVMYSILACSAVERQPVTREARKAQGTDEAAAAADDADSAAVAAALERALTAGWRELRLLDECRTDAGWTSVEVFGSGVGIWNGTAQFRLTPGEVRAFLEAVRDLGFAAMPGEYGVEEADSAIQVVCRVRLELDGVSKEVVQLQRGKPSPELRRLAERLLELAEQPASGGVTAADLDDGLAKIAAGELAGETLELLLHRKPADADAEGWLLRVEGRKASTRELRPEGGYADPIVLELQPEELSELAAFLAEQKVGELPVNLYAEHYTDFVARVLSRNRSIQARQFAGMTPERHGELQRRFDQIFEKLYELHRRVLDDGRTAG